MRSAVLMGRESVMNICEMMPREWIRYGELKDANSQLDAINAIDRHHIEQLSQKILAEYPVLAAIGDSRANALMSPEKMDKLIR
jgi:hypothetical protein